MYGLLLFSDVDDNTALFMMSELYWREAALLGQFVCSIAEKYELFPFGFVN